MIIIFLKKYPLQNFKPGKIHKNLKFHCKFKIRFINVEYLILVSSILLTFSKVHKTEPNKKRKHFVHHTNDTSNSLNRFYSDLTGKLTWCVKVVLNK